LAALTIPFLFDDVISPGMMAAPMRGLAKMAVCLAGGLALNISARAEAVVSSNNPYSAIAIRNVFGLKTPQPVVEEAPPVEAPPKITLDGIMCITGQRQALFKVPAAMIAGQPSKQDTCILSEGQRQNGIEVIHIDETGGLVTFNNHGIIQNISLTNAAGPGTPTLANGGTATTPNPYKPKMVGAVGSGRIPPYLGGGADNTGQGSQFPMTKEQQMQKIEAQRAYYNSQDDPESKRLARSLPPTAMTPPDAFGP
jgi:hypothetical protein